MSSICPSDFWNSLTQDWKVEFIKNLPSFINNASSEDEILKGFSESGKTISDILNLEKLEVSFKLVNNLTPVFFLEKLNDFYIHRPPLASKDNNYKGPQDFVYIYPKALRSKVKVLELHNCLFDGNFHSLKDFVNLEELYCQCCEIESLSGIENLRKLKKLQVDQGNFITDIAPLEGMNIIMLDIAFTNVTDLSSLKRIPSLEELWIEGLNEVKDYSVLLDLPNLKHIDIGGGSLPKEIEEELIKRGIIDSLPLFPDFLKSADNDGGRNLIKGKENSNDLPF